MMIIIQETSFVNVILPRKNTIVMRYNNERKKFMQYIS